MMKKPHFEKKESYLHLKAKEVLAEWITKYPNRFCLKNILSIRFEEMFCEEGFVVFNPDITVYDNNGLRHIYEINHKHPLTQDKIFNMHAYFFFNNEAPDIFEIEAYYIMKQISCPQNIKLTQRKMFDDGQLF